MAVATSAAASARLEIVSAVRPRWANASLAPRPTTTGRCSRRAIRGDARGAAPSVAPRPMASAAWAGRRPARHAGSAVAAATTSSAISSEPAQQRDAGRPVRGRAERVGLGGRQPVGDQRAGGEAERRRERGEHEVVGDEHAGHLRRREPDRAQQADLAARGEHAAADRGGEREAGGEQREQRRRLEDRQQPPRVVGELRALRAPVERAHAVALDTAGERLRGAGVGQPQRDAVADPAVAGRQPEDVGRVGPAAIVGARRRADADHLQRAVAGDDRGAEADVVLARPAARQHDLARGRGCGGPRGSAGPRSARACAGDRSGRCRRRGR